MKRAFSRRDFLKLAGLGLGSMALNPMGGGFFRPEYQFPSGERLGRISVYPNLYSTDVKARPDAYSATIRNVSEDLVVENLREVVGTSTYSAGNTVFQGSSRTWVETPEGYIYEPHLQPVKNLPNTPMSTLPEGKNGFWAEVSIPFVDLIIENPPMRSPSFRYLESLGQTPRLYYSQIVWIDQIRVDENGRVWYRFNEEPGKGYGYGDIFWADATAFRLITVDEIAPINPEIDPALKTIVINVYYQTLSCYEGSTEVYYCKVSTGIGDFSTPIGMQYVWRKMPSIHMSANTASDSGYDTPAVGWPTFINGDGVAIHSVFWHNDFGIRKSHGCINALPDDAKWIFRWTTPYVSFEHDEIQMTWPDVGTQVNVTEPRL
jgi:hypothetical protein